MKRLLTPVLIIAAVFCVTLFCQSFSILRQESLGLFLNTPDFYREIMQRPLPVSNLLGSFLVQFYANHYIGSAIVAILVLSMFLLLRGILNRITRHSSAASAALTCIAWWFLAKAHSPSLGVTIILFLLAVRFLASFFSRRNESDDTLKEMAISIAIIVSASFLIGFSPDIREIERMSKVEYAASDYNWNFILKIATPEAASKDKALIPYANMALNAKGELADKLTEYPVSNDFGLDFGSDQSYRAYHFKSILYSALGCHNEAIHNISQSGMLLPHGTSFRTLRELVRENYALGDSLMVVKYCKILERSLTNRNFVGYFRNNPVNHRLYNTPEESSKALMIYTKDQMTNMLQLIDAGLSSNMAMERYYAYYQIQEYFKNNK